VYDRYGEGELLHHQQLVPKHNGCIFSGLTVWSSQWALQLLSVPAAQQPSQAVAGIMKQQLQRICMPVCHTLPADISLMQSSANHSFLCPAVLCLLLSATAAEGLKGGVPPPGSDSSSPAAEGPSFTYSGVDPDMARRLFESLFGGAGGFTFSSMPGANMAGGGTPGGGSFQFMSTGPGGTTFASSGPGGNSGSPFNIHTSNTGAGNNRRRWASAFGGNDSDEDMFTAGAADTDPFAAFGGGGFFQQRPQQRPRPGSGGGGGRWGGSSAGGRPLSGFAGQQQQQPAPQLVALPLSLAELYKGCTRRLKVSCDSRGESTGGHTRMGLALRSRSDSMIKVSHV
jgi:hypothetical protein